MHSPIAAARPEHSSADQHQHRTERTVWIVTGYLASGLALLGVFAYYFANYVAK